MVGGKIMEYFKGDYRDDTASIEGIVEPNITNLGFDENVKVLEAINLISGVDELRTLQTGATPYLPATVNNRFVLRIITGESRFATPNLQELLFGYFGNASLNNPQGVGAFADMFSLECSPTEEQFFKFVWSAYAHSAYWSAFGASGYVNRFPHLTSIRALFFGENYSQGDT